MTATIELPLRRSKVEQAAGQVIDECLTPVGLKLTDTDLDFGVYEAIGAILGRWRDVTCWSIGDWILFGEATYGEKMAQAIEATKRSKSTLMNYARVCAAIPPQRRRQQLSFYHHRVVSSKRFTPDDQDRWLQEAIDHDWSIEEMEGAIAAIPAGGEQTALADTAGLDTHVNRTRLQELAVIIARQANPLGDGRFAVDGELIVQLRAAAGLED